MKGICLDKQALMTSQAQWIQQGHLRRASAPLSRKVVVNSFAPQTRPSPRAGDGHPVQVHTENETRPPGRFRRRGTFDGETVYTFCPDGTCSS